MVRPFTHDAYAPLSYVESLGDGTTPMPPGMTSSFWLDHVDARRLMAYRILAAKRDNVSRFYLPEKMWERGTGPASHMTELDRIRYLLAAVDEKSPAEKLREYGDAALLVEQGVSLLLGDSQDLVLPDLQALEQDVADQADTGDGQPQEPAGLARLRGFDDWLQQWADVERLPLRLMEGEENSVGDGDGIYVLGWSERLGRPRLRVFDPGWYFPDLTTMGDDEEYPRVVHVAWEEDQDGVQVLHRISWRLVDGADDDPHPLAPQAPYTPAYADKPTTRALVYSVTQWRLDRLRHGDSIYNLADDDPRAKVIVAPVVEMVDFLTVVHVPNDAAGKRHFGRSILLNVAQALDDVAGTDTDLQANSELVGSTPTVVTGGGGGQLDGGPGSQWNLPAGGDAKFLDTSRALLGLTGYSKWLLSRVSVNSRMSETLLGRVSPADVPSGYAFDLGFAPTRSLIRKMRLVRQEKYPLLLKFALRLAQVHGVLDGGETPRAEIALGGYLPADKAGAMTRVKDGLAAHAISRRTAVQILVEADYPIEDAEAEVERIRNETFTDMVALVDALGTDGMNRVREWLGMDVPAPAPPVQLPPPAPPVPPVPVPPVPGPPAP